MNKFTFALVVALSSGYASASGLTGWGGELDGHFEPPVAGNSDSMTGRDSRVDIEAAYQGLDGQIDDHFFISDMPVSTESSMADRNKVYADLDGNSDLIGGV